MTASEIFNLILGAATWSKSLSQTTLVHEAYFESAIAIPPGKNKTFVQVITLGFNAAIYSQALPIMQGQGLPLAGEPACGVRNWEEVEKINWFMIFMIIILFFRM